ncbi:class I SAM-dependent methyltransferase [Saccharothrix violaceirubra]|uniref:SAM-dependent methyltransferase n=1 Tax=Saccharothrix violaceirubra TaxID=413306 RepID=A0A7W7T0I0_9PSEU|nr:class I SAM-dependent methyltransferase [Saccharothrix violaceirubra]MBB4964255.1 SAM-dependent methyltransferase [Saccharothrix violaceirubra]
MDDVADEIVEHYRSIDESTRITEGFGRLELERTREIVRRHLPPGGLRVLDVGGATGAHAAWLAADGHRVALFDVVAEHVARARRLAEDTPGLTADLGDARDLPVPDDSFDAALVFGPLYHLTEHEDRLAALREVRRAVRPGGWIFVAAVSRFASLFDGLARGFLFDPEFRRIVAADLATGRHRNDGHHPGWFTTAYFHRPEELRQECVAAGLEVVEVVGVEGLAVWLSHLADRWSDPADREVVPRSARLVESEPALLGLSAHLVAVTRTPA